MALKGGLLIKVLELSIDPYMRNRMREPSLNSYLVSVCVFFCLTTTQNILQHLLFSPLFLLENRKIGLFTSTRRMALIIGLFSSLAGFGVGRVIRSELSGAKPGDYVTGFLGQLIHWIVSEVTVMTCALCLEHQNFVIKENLKDLQILQNPYNLPLSTFLGVLGMPGYPFHCSSSLIY